MKLFTLIIIGLFMNTLSYSQAAKFVPKDTVYIGSERAVKLPSVYFAEKRENVHVLIDEGTYYLENELFVTGKFIIVEGRGSVNLYCKKLYNWSMRYIDTLHV